MLSDWTVEELVQGFKPGCITTEILTRPLLDILIEIDLKENEMPEPKPTPEALQEESATLLSRVRPLLDGIDMAIRREAKPSDLEGAWREVKAINRRFNAVQKQIRGGVVTR